MLKNIDQLRLKAIYVQQLREGSSINFLRGKEENLSTSFFFLRTTTLDGLDGCYWKIF